MRLDRPSGYLGVIRQPGKCDTHGNLGDLARLSGGVVRCSAQCLLGRGGVGVQLNVDLVQVFTVQHKVY